MVESIPASARVVSEATLVEKVWNLELAVQKIASDQGRQEEVWALRYDGIEKGLGEMKASLVSITTSVTKLAETQAFNKGVSEPKKSPPWMPIAAAIAGAAVTGMLTVATSHAKPDDPPPRVAVATGKVGG